MLNDTATEEVSVCDWRYWRLPLVRFWQFYCLKEISFYRKIWYPVKHFSPGYFTVILKNQFKSKNIAL